MSTSKRVKRGRSAKSGGQTSARGVPGSEQDPKRRLGTFTGTGEHARKGGRTKGIVGHSKQNARRETGRGKRSD